MTPAPAAGAAAATPGRPAEAATAVLPARIYFETGSAEIGEKGQETIRALADRAAGGSGLRLDLTGLTDRTGDLATNEALSKRRAEAVRAALVARGVPEAAVSLKPPRFVETGQAGADAEARRVEISQSE